MNTEAAIQRQLERRYEAGFVTDIESDTLPPGLDEDVVRWISARKGEPEWLTEWRLAAYRHFVTMEATAAYEGARAKLAAFLNVSRDDLVLTSGTTMAINLVAYSYGLPRLKEGDVVLLTRMARPLIR